MKVEVQNYETISDELRTQYGDELTTFERLSLAIQIERNQILENGLEVTADDSKPPALTAIAQALGYDSSYSSTIVDVLKDLVNIQEKK